MYATSAVSLNLSTYRASAERFNRVRNVMRTFARIAAMPIMTPLEIRRDLFVLSGFAKTINVTQ